MHNFASIPTRWLIDHFPLLKVIPANIMVINFTLTLLAASLSWFLIEKPLNDMKRFFPYRPKPRQASDI